MGTIIDVSVLASARSRCAARLVELKAVAPPRLYGESVLHRLAALHHLLMAVTLLADTSVPLVQSYAAIKEALIEFRMIYHDVNRELDEIDHLGVNRWKARME